MVSSLHASVLGTTVPGVSSTTAASSVSSTSSTTSSTSSSYDSVSFSSTGQMMAAEGSHPPDFDSMSTEEFRDHLVELQETMAANGVDTSSFTDPTTMSDEDLNALKSEMSSMGKGGPRGGQGMGGAQGKQGPPPPPPSSSSSTEETTEDETLAMLLEALESNEDDSSDLLSSLL